MRRDALRLQDMVEAADPLAAYLRDLSREKFSAGGLAQDAILRQLWQKLHQFKLENTQSARTWGSGTSGATAAIERKTMYDEI